MERLSASQLLTVWERGAHQPGAVRALILLAAACPRTDPGAIAGMPVGARDARLLELREALFGPTLQCLTRCPKCGDLLDLEFPTDRIRVQGVTAREDSESGERIEVEGYEVRFRLPNSSDLIELQDVAAVSAAEQQLLSRCVVQARERDCDIDVDALPALVIATIAQRMAEADPQADVQLALSCPACGHRWQAAFDIVSHLWMELEACAKQLLSEIHMLASAYGWREADILAMAPSRRRAYLDLCRT